MSENSIEETILDLKPLLHPVSSEGREETEEILEPTLENIKKALVSNKIPSKKVIHKASSVEFVIQAISSDSYTALSNIGVFNETGTQKVSTMSEDEHEKNILYLVHGIQKPKLDRKYAEAMLKAPGWGPSNSELIQQIRDMNPAPEEQITNFTIIAALCRYQLIFLKVLQEVGAIDDLCNKYKLKNNVKNTINHFMSVFYALLSAQSTCDQWGIVMTKAGVSNLLNDLNDLEESIFSNIEIENNTSDELDNPKDSVPEKNNNTVTGEISSPGLTLEEGNKDEEVEVIGIDPRTV